MFLPTNTVYNTNQWTHNWQIQTHWSGSLINKSQFNRKFNGDKYYLEPFFLLSLFPHTSLKSGKVYKLYLGFNFRAVFDKSSRAFLRYLYDPFKLRFGININDGFKKNCTLLVDHTHNYADFVDEKVTKQNNSYVTKINWNKPFLIPFRCLQKNKENNIKIWWSSQQRRIDLPWSKHRFRDFLENTTTFRISFRHHSQTNINLKLLSDQTTNIHTPYWYFIHTKLGEPTQIIAVAQEIVRLQSLLKKFYPNSIPFKSLWKIIYQPVKLSASALTKLLQNFVFYNLLNDLRFIINWNHPQSLIKTKTQTLDQHQNQQLYGRLVLIKKILHRSFTLPAPLLQKLAKLMFYDQHLQQMLLTGNTWNIIKQKFTTNPFSQKTFISNWKTENNRVILQSSFIWSSFLSLQISLQQVTQFKNHLWNKQIQIYEIKNIPAKKEEFQTNQQEFWLSFANLRKIAFEKNFTLEKYLLWRRKWQRNAPS